MHAEAAIQITEFCPDPYQYSDADEYLVLSGTGLLDDFTVSDGRGGFRFPAGTKIDGSITIARSGIAFAQSYGKYPDFEWIDYSPLVRNVISGDVLPYGECPGFTHALSERFAYSESFLAG